MTALESSTGDAYPAGVGWDEATGLGSVDAAAFYDQLENDAIDPYITAYAGTGAQGCAGDGGAPTAMTFKSPVRVATASDGSIYVVDQTCNQVRRIDTNGTVVTVAGTGASGYSGDGGYAINATLRAPGGIAVDANQNVYIADTGNNVVREITGGKISTIAGTGTAGYNGGGAVATRRPRQGTESTLHRRQRERPRAQGR